MRTKKYKVPGVTAAGAGESRRGGAKRGVGIQMGESRRGGVGHTLVPGVSAPRCVRSRHSREARVVKEFGRETAFEARKGGLRREILL